MLLNNFNQYDQVHCSGKISPTSVAVDKLEESMRGFDLNDVIIALNQSQPRAA